MTEVVSAVATPLVLDGGKDARVGDVLVPAITSASASVPVKDVDVDDAKKLGEIQERVKLEVKESSDVDAHKVGDVSEKDTEASVLEKTKDGDVPGDVARNVDVNADADVAVPPVKQDPEQVQEEQETGVVPTTTVDTDTDEVKKSEETSSGDANITESAASPGIEPETDGGVPSTESEVAIKTVDPPQPESETQNQVETATVEEEEKIVHDRDVSADTIVDAGVVAEIKAKEVVNEEETAKIAEPAAEEAQGEARSAQENLVKEGTFATDEAAQEPVKSDPAAQEPSSSVPTAGEETNPTVDSKPVPEAQQVVEPLQESSIKEEAAATVDVAQMPVEADTPAQDPPPGPSTETETKLVDVVEPTPDVQSTQAQELTKENPSKVEEPIVVEEPVAAPASTEAPVQAEAPISSLDTPAELPDTDVKEEAAVTGSTSAVDPESVAAPVEPSSPLPISETEEKPVVSAEATQQSEAQPLETEPVKVEEATTVEEPEATVIQEADTDKDEAKLSEIVAEPVAKEPTEDEVKPQEVEAPSEVPKGGEESSKAEQPVEVVDPVTAEEQVAVEQPVPAESLPAESGARQEIIVEGTNNTGLQAVHPPEQREQEDAVDDAARKAYELAHEHVNDEVNFDQPTEEEIRAVSLEDAVLESKEAAPELPTPTSEADTKEESTSIPPASESGMESLSNIPSDSGDVPSVATVPSISPSEEVAKRDEKETEASEAPIVSEVQPEKESEAIPEVTSTKLEVASTGHASTSEPTEGVKLDSVVIGEVESADVVAATSAEPTLAAEPAIETQEDKNVAVLDALKETTETAETALPVDVPSDEVHVSCSEENKEVPSEAPKEVETPIPTDEVGEPAEPARDTPVEPVVDVVADVPAVNDIVEPKEEPSVAADVPAVSEVTGPTDVAQEVAVSESSNIETREEVPTNVDSSQEEVMDELEQTEDLVPAAVVVADATVADEATVPANAAQEVLESEPASHVEQEEEVLSTEDAAKDVPHEELEGERKLTEGLVPPAVVAESEAAAPTPEPASQRAILSGEVPASDEPVATEAADLTKEDVVQETPTTETYTPEGEASSTDTPVPPASAEELTDATLEEVEGTGIAEPAATPASDGPVGRRDKAPRSDELEAIIEQVDEILKEEGTEEVVAPAEELPETEQRVVVAGADVEVEPPVLVPGQEEQVTDATPAATAEIVEEPIAKQDPEESSRDPLEEAKLVEPTEDVGASVSQAQEPTQSASAVAKAPVAAPEGTEVALQTEAELDGVDVKEIVESETIVAAEGTQEAAEAVPDVLMETPTPVSETLTELSDEDEGESVPVEVRLAQAVGIPPEEVAGLPALSTSVSGPSEGGVTATEDEAKTPTETKDEVIPDEGEVKEETLITDSLELETPTQSVTLEKPETEEEPTPAGLSVDTDVSEVPERPRSPWTPSYSVIQQGTSPVHPVEEPKEEPVVEQPVEVAVEEVVTGKVEEVTPEAVAPPSEEREPPLETTPAESASAAQVPEPAVTEATVSEAKPSEPEGTETLLEDVGREEPPTQTEAVQAQTSEEVVEEVEPEVPAEIAPANLTVDTSAKEVPDRPKSPWTPSYSVTKLGPGVPEPEELHLDAEVPIPESKDDLPAPTEPVQQLVTEVQEAAPAPDVAVEITKAPESAQDVERPKSPYPIAYSVTLQGPGAVEEATPSAEVFDNTPYEDAGSIADSNEPEAPLTPRSELGAITPGFDSLSEVSDSSHIPNPPDSPRTDPEVTSLASVEVKTPLVVGAEVQGESVSPIHTPVLSAQKALEVFDEAEPLTEFAIEGVSGVTPAVHTGTASAATESWVKETHDERESYVDSEGPVTETSVEKDVAEEGAIQFEAAGKETAEAVATNIMDGQSLEQKDVQNEEPELPTSTPELLIPKVDVTSAHPAAPPVIVTNTLSTDSAFTQVSRTFSTSQETTATDITTPDVEAPPASKFKRGGSEVESLDEETTVTHLSDEPRGSDTATTTHSPTGKSFGIAHTLAMRSFPSAFAQTEGPSTSEQPNQASEIDSSELDDQLSPISASRRRLESTASALAFPGGWVSSPTHVERASLEVAKGEFVKPAFEGKPISTSSPGGTPPSNENDNEIKEEEKGSGWRCVIM